VNECSRSRSSLYAPWVEPAVDWRAAMPAQVESLKHSVLEAKKDVQASGFYAALMAALHATCLDGDDEAVAAGGDGGTGHANGLEAAKETSAGSESPQQQHQQEQLTEEGSHGSGGSSSMAVDQPSGSSPMATDGAGLLLIVTRGRCMLHEWHEYQTTTCAWERLRHMILQARLHTMRPPTCRTGLQQHMMPSTAAPPAMPLLRRPTCPRRHHRLLAAQHSPPRPLHHPKGGGGGQMCGSWWCTAWGPSNQVGDCTASMAASKLMSFEQWAAAARSQC
jgi:hypothetical protein